MVAIRRKPRQQTFIPSSLGEFLGLPTPKNTLLHMGCGASAQAPDVSVVPAPSTDPQEEPPAEESASSTSSITKPREAAAEITESEKPTPKDSEPTDQTKSRDEAKLKREEQRALTRKQMQKDRDRFKQGLPTSPVANDLARQQQVSDFNADVDLAAQAPPPSESPKNSVTSKEQGMITTDYE